MYFKVRSLKSQVVRKWSAKANLFPQILARIHIAEKTNQNIIDNFLTSRIGQPVQFTARGFFTISNRTLFNVRLTRY
ncbi:hypothetical protein GQX74_001113 [Glossina fuscipes]|nr:hypothetical protein GQX74_001113 [Glossina fuscipes]